MQHRKPAAEVLELDDPGDIPIAEAIDGQLVSEPSPNSSTPRRRRRGGAKVSKPEAKPESRLEKWFRNGTSGVTVLLAIFTGMLAYNQFVVARDDATRVEQSRVYPAFLQAANQYLHATQRTEERLTTCGDSAACDQILEDADFLTPRAEYQRSLNEVFVYGSDAAWSKAEDIGSTLPDAVGDFDGELRYSEARFSQLYREFLSIMCTELPTQSRSGCWTR